VLSVYYDEIFLLKFPSRHFLLYAVYISQKIIEFCLRIQMLAYQQKYKLASLQLAHPVQSEYTWELLIHQAPYSSKAIRQMNYFSGNSYVTLLLCPATNPKGLMTLF